MEILSAESTELFIGTEEQPAQVIRVRVRGTEGDDLSHLSQVSVRGEHVSTDHPVALDPLPPGELRTVEVGVTVDGTPAPGTTFAAEAIVELDAVIARLPMVVTVAEPGWRMFMVSHFHYDPVWWNTQAAYTETWGTERQFRALFQEPGLALVKAHLEMARRDPDYKFVLAELDYLKPYWGVYPEDRDYFRQLLAEGRLELMGGTYNEPNTNLTSAESTIRNAIYGVGYQRDVLGGSPDGVAAGRLRPRPAVPRHHGRRGHHLELLGPRPVPRMGPPLGARARGAADRHVAPRGSAADAVPFGVRLDRAERPRAADELHGQPLLGRLVDGRLHQPRAGGG